jgi:LCP family protein required for cell wall assembly
MARERRRNRRSLDPLTIGLGGAFVVLAIAVAVLLFVVVRNIVNSWEVTELPGQPPSASSSGGITTPLDELPDVQLSEEEMAQPMQSSGDAVPAEPWDGATRVNVLIMGLDYRDWEAGEIPRTDTMILFTMDPVSKTAGMLSIPRDMWVDIPNYGYAKINTAYYLGEINNLPGGGPALAMDTVEHFLGVPIDYYAQIDFYAFVKFIDSLGGLDLNVPDEITVDPLGPGNTVKLYPGVQTLDGATTLAFARTRYTEGGDFDRASRQQLVVMELRRQIVSLNMLPTLIAKAPVLYQDLSSGIRTNLSLKDVISLAWTAKDIKENDIKQGVISPPDQVLLDTSPDGLSILIPVHDRIQILRDEIFTSGVQAGPAAVNSDAAQLVSAEQARVSVRNGTATAGLATRTSDYLRSLGMNVVEEANADRVYERSSIIVVNGKPNTITKLAELMGVDSGNISFQYNPDEAVDVILIVGNDWANNNPMP